MKHKYTYDTHVISHDGEWVYYYNVYERDESIFESEYFDEQEDCFKAGEEHCIKLEDAEKDW